MGSACQLAYGLMGIRASPHLGQWPGSNLAGGSPFLAAATARSPTLVIPPQPDFYRGYNQSTGFIYNFNLLGPGYPDVREANRDKFGKAIQARPPKYSLYVTGKDGTCRQITKCLFSIRGPNSTIT